MPHLTTDDGVKLYYEETGKGIPIVFIHEFAGDYRSWEQQVRYFGALLPLHRGQCARLSALRCAEGRREVFAGARARRHPRGARCAQDRQGAHRRPVDGRVRDLAFRLHLSGSRPLAGDRGLRLWRRAGQARAVRRRSRGLGQALRGTDDGEGRRRLMRSGRRACSTRTAIRAAGANSPISSPSTRPRARR